MEQQQQEHRRTGMVRRFARRAVTAGGAVTLASMWLSSRALADSVGGITITKNSSLPGTSLAEKLVGGLETIALIAGTAGFFIGLVVWAFAAHSSNPHMSNQGRKGVVTSLGVFLMVGGGAALLNWALTTGSSIKAG